MLGRCPSCWKSFLQHICAMTCGPQHSLYLQPAAYEKFNDQAHQGHAGKVSIMLEVLPAAHLRYDLWAAAQPLSTACCIKLVKALLGRYPSCWKSFLQHICAMTCGPQHSLYLQPAAYEKFNDQACQGHAGTMSILLVVLPAAHLCYDLWAAAQPVSTACCIKLVKAMLGRCPSCWKSFLQHICAMTCGPQHSLYLQPAAYEKFNDQAGQGLAGKISIMLEVLPAAHLRYDLWAAAQPLPSTCCIKLVKAMLGRCPSCWKSFLQHICAMTCGPQHSLYLQPAAYEKFNETADRVTAVDFHLSMDYIGGTYNSCSQVQNPSTNGKAMDLICGDTNCDPMKWFEFMGDAQGNPYVPFQINYKQTPLDGRPPLNPETTPCNVGIDGQPGCSCLDCDAACPAPPPPSPLPKPFSINGADGYAVVMAIVFVIFTTLFLGGVYCCNNPDNTIGVASEHNTEMATNPTWRIDRPDGPMTTATFLERLGATTETKLEDFFQWWGTQMAQRPWVVLFFGLCLVVGLGHGIKYMQVTTNPVELWASPTSRSRVEREYFDSHFEPFYRTEMLIISAKNLPKIKTEINGQTYEFGPVFNKEFMMKVYELQKNITDLNRDNNGTKLEDICFAPMSNTPSTDDPSQCAIMSVWGWFKNSLDEFDEDDYLEKIFTCSNTPFLSDCLAPYGGPALPAVALGGFLQPGEQLGKNTKYYEANALILTFLVNNKYDKKQLEPALEWEQKFISFVKNFTENDMPKWMDIAYTSERSIEDELARETQSDVSTVLVSYLIMFAYIAISLGRFTTFSRLLIDSKVTLGLGGVLIVLASVVCSIGMFGFIGVPATLIIVEVIPFLVLAVGVDNIFILVQTNQREGRRPNETVPEHIGRTLGQVGPSMFLTSISESVCFFLGALSDMPAVRAFALYAGAALLVDFLLQVTCFIALLAIDTYRQNANRFDIFCCVQGTKADNAADGGEGALYNMFKHVYVPFLMKREVRAAVMVIFFAWLCSSVAVSILTALSTNSTY
ncbi:sterol-sensing domain of SREBP cleavage-activation domain-containing protein [Phthorimaea operculella]|nr:sterol-sensing domain of SREBP cleavage-activation domain-containing protein [Phthorimaea operculella]